MKYQSISRVFWCLSLGLFVYWTMSIPNAWSVTIRITMTDNTTIETSRYWEEGDQIMFEITGGVAGIPKSEISSIQEIIANEEFAPEILLKETPPAEGKSNPFQEEVASQILPKIESYEALEHRETEVIRNKLEGGEGTELTAPTPKPVLSPLMDQKQPFAYIGRAEGKDDMLIFINPVVMPDQVRDNQFVLVLYDADGNVLKREPLKVYEVNMDQKTLKELGISGKVFSLVATIEANPEIKRYEITTPGQY